MGLGVSQLRLLKQLEEENRTLKQPRVDRSTVLTTGLWDVGRALPKALFLSAAALTQLGTLVLILWHQSGGLGRAARWVSGLRLDGCA